MNTWYSQARMSAEHRNSLLAEVERNRQVRLGRKEQAERKDRESFAPAPGPRWTVRKLASALNRALRTVH